MRLLSTTGVANQMHSRCCRPGPEAYIATAATFAFSMLVSGAAAAAPAAALAVTCLLLLLPLLLLPLQEPSLLLPLLPLPLPPLTTELPWCSHTLKFCLFACLLTFYAHQYQAGTVLPVWHLSPCAAGHHLYAETVRCSAAASQGTTNALKK